ncbi:MAG: hypothetical protein B7X04_02260 [Parcubacteria group bacterium 21-54-25]|nr:MAG: hypothetical protein B7X04_02260 [Parcubacteria group bacterium 21-54-25]HQU07871.1 HYR domain-containing protein [Candidatus Paceibacterota bacterium]
MKKSSLLLLSVLTTRTARIVALSLSVSAIAMGGFFISQAYASSTVNVITFDKPISGSYVRGTTALAWQFTQTVFSSTANLTYSSNFSSWQNNVIGSSIATTTLNYDWPTVDIPNGTYEVRLEDSLNNSGTSATFNIDNTPPTTTLATTTSPDPTTGWYNNTSGYTPPQITLTCTDNLSGCLEIVQNWYNATSSALVASATTTGATATIDPSSIPQGDNILVYYSEDNAVDKHGVHNVEKAHQAEFKVDTQAPSISSYTLNGKAADAYLNPNLPNASTTITLTANEPVDWSSIQMVNASGSSVKTFTVSSTYDGTNSATVTWDGKTATSTASEGIYTIKAHIIDLHGNDVKNISLTLYTITIDTTPPTLTLSSPVANTVYESKTANGNTTASTTALDFTASDANPLTYTYSIDGHATTSPATAQNGVPTTAALSGSGLTDGQHTLVVTVTDGAGNSVSSAPVSFVFDNNKTLTVSNQASDNADFSSIGAAVAASDAAGLSGEAISVYKGTGSYAENVTLDNPFTLESQSSSNEAVIKGTVTIPSTGSGTTVQNLSFTNPGASTALVISGASNVRVASSTFNGIGTGTATGNIQAIDVNSSGGTSMSDITISGNTITNVGNNSNGSSKGIYIGDSTGSNTISNVTIDGNQISSITADNSNKGAYGVLVNHATSVTGATTGLLIQDNTISGLNGLWAHAIGLEGNTPSAVVTGNIISGLTDNKDGTDDVGVMLQDDGGVSTVTISKNQFASDIIGVGNATTTLTATTTATGNWWGSIQGPKTSAYATISNPYGDGASVYGPVSYTPWCTDSSCSSTGSAPTAVVTNPPHNPTNVTSPRFTVGSATSSASTVVYYKYQLDGYPWSAATSTSVAIATSSLADGSHTLNVLGRDQAGNWQTTPTTYTWTINTTAPVLKEVTPITTPTASTTVSYVFNTTKPGSLAYAGSCNNGSLRSVSAEGNATTTFSSLSDGLYNSCTITETDNAGNTSNVLTIAPFIIDTTPPVINVGPAIIASTTVTENATATDALSGVASTTWTQVAGPGTVTFGSLHATSTTLTASIDGLYTLQLAATDKAGNTSTATLSFTWDTVPPTITAPANITKEATGSLTPVTLGTPTVSDNLSTTTGSIKVTNDTPSAFPVGTTTVTWTATDAAGNSASTTQEVGIIDTIPPTISGTPANITAEATSSLGAYVSWTSPTATDVVDGTDTVSCLPASGSQFNLGTTTVSCSATDHAGNTASTTFKVAVRDTTPPIIASHADITVTADQLGGSKVTYTAPNSTDAVDGTVAATCAPASGTLFPVNATTTVTCTKTDAHGNVATPTTFTVTVNPGPLVQLGITAAPTNPTTANASTITVSGQDQYGNTVPSDNSTIAVLSTDGGGTLGTTLLTLVNGASTTELTSTQPGTVHVNAASSPLTPAQTTVTFTGATVPDTTPPIISSIQSTNIGTSTVTITWLTNENATSQVEYGTTSGYGTSTAVDSTLTSSHSVTLTGLTPNTTYHFRVKSADASNNLATSVDNTFTTAVDNNTAVLAVNGIDATKTYAIADDTFGNGWAWTFHVTVPTTEQYLSMKFNDFLGAPSGTIPVAGNVRFYSLQSSDANATTSAITIAGPGAYSAPMHLTGDLAPGTAGRQVDIVVEMRVPTGTTGGSYSTSYGIQSTSTPPVIP